MNIGAISCIVFASIFIILAIVFTLLKGKAAILISGFNSLTREERRQYDQAQMSKDHRNMLLLWVALFSIGALVSAFISPFAAICTFAIWFVLFFKEVHIDTDKAFGKYKSNHPL